MEENDTPIGLEPIEFPDFWAGVINQGRIDDLIALYRNGAVLMPTFSPNSVRNETDLRHYFEGLASKKNLQVRVHERNLDCLLIEKHCYVVSGIYEFSFEDDGALQRSCPRHGVWWPAFVMSDTGSPQATASSRSD